MIICQCYQCISSKEVADPFISVQFSSISAAFAFPPRNPGGFFHFVIRKTAILLVPSCLSRNILECYYSIISNMDCGWVKIPWYDILIYNSDSSFTITYDKTSVCYFPSVKVSCLVLEE